MNTHESPDGAILLNLQMILDPMDDRAWKYTAHLPEHTPCFRGCLLYCGQRDLQKDTLYLIPEGQEQDFPADRYSFVTTGSLAGAAPHLRDVQGSFGEVFNQVMRTFQQYHDFETRLNNAITGGGDLNQLCRIASDFLHNPVYIHDSLFSIIATSGHVDGMLELEHNPSTGKTYIPLWLINEFKFDESYQKTLTYREAGIWGLDQYPHNMRSLYVNLIDGNQYLGRLLVNEIGTLLQPGQPRVLEYLSKYMIRLVRSQERTRSHSLHNFEETLVDLILHGQTNTEDLQAMLDILEWKASDNFLCIKIQSQDQGISIRSTGALINWIAGELRECVTCRRLQQLFVVVNLTRSGLNPQEIRQLLAPQIRDSYMYGGSSGIVRGIHQLKDGFQQADIALEYITKRDSRNWLISYPNCALSYLSRVACRDLPREMVVHPAVLDLQEFDRANGTQYYETLRTYLVCERDIPKTSAELIIHRTTLTYRLKKLADIAPVNLDDPGTRLYLLFSFYLMEQNDVKK